MFDCHSSNWRCRLQNVLMVVLMVSLCCTTTLDCPIFSVNTSRRYKQVCLDLQSYILIYSLAHTLTRTCTYCSHSLTHSPTLLRSLTHSLTHLLTHFPTCSPTYRYPCFPPLSHTLSPGRYPPLPELSKVDLSLLREEVRWPSCCYLIKPCCSLCRRNGYWCCSTYSISPL